MMDAKTRRIHGLNSSGRAPAAATVEEFQKRKLDRIPLRGELSVSVPGVTTCVTSRLTMPFASFGSSICSQTATR